MEKILMLIEVVGGFSALVSGAITVLVWAKRIIEGQKCQLRVHILETYYRNAESKTIRQFELENFLLMYKAYKALKGNSFVDKIHSEVIKWRIYE